MGNIGEWDFNALQTIFEKLESNPVTVGNTPA